jgi:hypothetical protein
MFYEYFVSLACVQCCEYEESDSGYSDPSPDGGGQMRDKSPLSDEDPVTTADRKSMFSDMSDEEEDEEKAWGQQHDIFPTVIIKNQEDQQSAYFAPSPTFGRQYGRQRSVFQTPGKDILTSVVSRDDLAVIGEDSVVNAAAATPVPPKERRPPSMGSSNVSRSAVYDDTYRRSVVDGGRRPLQAVPSRLAAQKQEEKPEKNGCFYVMTALDFCWCL